ncbi:hypothetical protein [Shewanella sp. SR44-3]|uniref:hypothetical protein n=1 Tax=Shewanella sp. SR44-3 TaxID=2760936 RepID=UPI0015F8E8A0|nr:hypothetical protein [Shewanella sp. SR44-3]MBB1271092.1 hypothetical protein [Shewanella sp. SR44-3]
MEFEGFGFRSVVFKSIDLSLGFYVFGFRSWANTRLRGCVFALFLAEFSVLFNATGRQRSLMGQYDPHSHKKIAQ